MRFGLDLTLKPASIGPAGPIASPPPSPPPPPAADTAEPGLQPVPGILDAANVVILGASIMEGAFGRSDDGSLRQSIVGCAAAAGFTGTLRSYASSGDKIADTRTEYATAKADLSADEGRNLYIAHTGGNIVSGARPFPGRQATFEAPRRAMTGWPGWGVIPIPSTFSTFSSRPDCFLSCPGWPRRCRRRWSGPVPLPRVWRGRSCWGVF